MNLGLLLSHPTYQGHLNNTFMYLSDHFTEYDACMYLSFTACFKAHKKYLHLLVQLSPFAVLQCYMNPCQNGGACTELLWTSSYQCACVAGYTGVDCDIGILLQ